MGRGTGVAAATATSIEITFEYRGRRCRERLKLRPTEANVKYAKNLKARIEYEITVGTFDYAAHFPKSKRAREFAKNPAQIVTVGELLTDWLKHVHKELEPETYADYAEYVSRTWRPRFGRLRLSELTIHRVSEWIAEQTCSRKRMLNVLTPLRQAMRYAVKPCKLLPEDPLGRISIKRPEALDDGDALIDPFTGTEIAAILPKLEPQVANMVEFWVWTGLRQGELIALTWADADFERGIIRITKAARGARRKAPKTRAGRREVKLLPPALEALRRQKGHTRMLHREIFLDPGTRPRGNDKAPDRAPAAWANDKQIRVRWAEALKQAGVRYRFPRQLRHTYASWMLMQRESLMWVAQQMGHKDASITQRVYAKYIPEMNPDAGMTAWRAIAAAMTTPRPPGQE
jgi:integrase